MAATIVLSASMDGAIIATPVGETQKGAADGSDLLRPRKDRRSFLRWSFCAATAILAHGAIATVMLHWQTEADAITPTAAVVIELSPVVTVPEELEMDTPPAPDLIQAESPSDKVVDKDIEDRQKAVEETLEPRLSEPGLEPTPEVAPSRPRQASREVDVQPVEATSQPTPVVVIAQKSEAELAPPPQPNDGKHIDARPPRPTAQPKPARPAPNKPKKQARDQTVSKPQPAEVRQAVAAQAPAASTPSNSDALPNWKSEIIGILERNKRYPAQAQARQEHGVSNLAFSLNRQGRVTAARITVSSGSATLDAETLALVRRVQPFPPPPPEVLGTQISLVVAIRYQ
jgi:periplasmic protein TonB